MHAGLLWQAAAFCQVAGGAGGDDILPYGHPSAGTGNDMIERQITAGAAILALETVAQKDIETGESRSPGRPDITL